MPYPEFYGIHRRSAADMAKRIQDICANQDRAAWADLYEQLLSIRPAPRIGGVGSPIFLQDDPVATAGRGYEPVSPEQPPAEGSPPLQRLLAELTMLTAPLRYSGGDDGWNGTFSDGLDIESNYRAPDDRAEFKMWGERIFWTTLAFPKPFEHLNYRPDAYCAYLTNESLKELLDVERRVGLLDRVANDLTNSGDQFGRIFADEMRKMLHFMELVRWSGFDLYYQEYAT